MSKIAKLSNSKSYCESYGVEVGGFFLNELRVLEMRVLEMRVWEMKKSF